MYADRERFLLNKFIMEVDKSEDSTNTRRNADIWVGGIAKVTLCDRDGEPQDNGIRFERQEAGNDYLTLGGTLLQINGVLTIWAFKEQVDECDKVADRLFESFRQKRLYEDEADPSGSIYSLRFDKYGRIAQRPRYGKLYTIQLVLRFQRFEKFL